MRRRRLRRAHVNHDRWLVSYADFITLLFAFFVVLYSTAQVDKRKMGKLSTAIHTAFEQLGAFPTSDHPTTPAIPATPATQNPVLNTPPPVVAQPSAQYDSDLTALRKELERALAQEIARKEVSVRSVPEGLIISLKEVGFYGSGSAGIQERSQPAFARMAALLGQGKYHIRIEGHTDNVRIHNSQFASNWELSTARATEMVQMLITKHQFPPEALSAAGYAQYHPIAPNDSEKGRSMNRRVDVVILGRLQPTQNQDTVSPGPTVQHEVTVSPDPAVQH